MTSGGPRDGQRFWFVVTDTSDRDNAAALGLNFSEKLAFADVAESGNLGGIPTIATDYSPLWDLNLGEWTQDAVDNGYCSRMIEEFAILGMVERGFVTGPGGAPYGSVGIIINCPIVQRLL